MNKKYKIKWRAKPGQPVLNLKPMWSKHNAEQAAAQMRIQQPTWEVWIEEVESING
jgi:hypothetical protein